MKDRIEVSFYHFTVTPIIVGIPKLIKKIYYAKKNLLVICKTNEEMKDLNKTLWTFDSREFIPHGLAIEANSELQPVLLSTDVNSNKNNAEILLSLCLKEEDLNLKFKKYLYAFYGNLDEVKNMIDLYSEYKTRSDIITIFCRQERSGKWSNGS